MNWSERWPAFTGVVDVYVDTLIDSNICELWLNDDTQIIGGSIDDRHWNILEDQECEDARAVMRRRLVHQRFRPVGQLELTPSVAALQSTSLADSLGYRLWSILFHGNVPANFKPLGRLALRAACLLGPASFNRLYLLDAEQRLEQVAERYWQAAIAAGHPEQLAWLAQTLKCSGLPALMAMASDLEMSAVARETVTGRAAVSVRRPGARL